MHGQLKSIEEVRGMLGGISSATVYRLVARGDLAIVKIGARTLFRAEDVEELVERSLRRFGAQS